MYIQSRVVYTFIGPGPMQGGSGECFVAPGGAIGGWVGGSVGVSTDVPMCRLECRSTSRCVVWSLGCCVVRSVGRRPDVSLAVTLDVLFFAGPTGARYATRYAACPNLSIQFQTVFRCLPPRFPDRPEPSDIAGSRPTSGILIRRSFPRSASEGRDKPGGSFGFPLGGEAVSAGD